MLAETAAAAPAAPPTPAPLGLDERLVLAALAVSDSGPLDLAAVITGPVQLPEPPRPEYPTPVAALLQRAARRLEVGGWCRGATVDEDGARCLYGAVRGEDPGGAHTDDALTVLLDAIRRRFPDADTIPEANDHRLPNSRVAVRVLGEAAVIADARGL